MGVDGLFDEAVNTVETREQQDKMVRRHDVLLIKSWWPLLDSFGLQKSNSAVEPQKLCVATLGVLFRQVSV